jgi:DNA integrity scanning protein DisA with diadenylate cyclase activity
MDSLDGVLTDIMADIDSVFLFAPNEAFYERFEGSENVVVIAAENTVDAEQFVELPIEFTSIRDRIRFGIEGAMDTDLVAEGNTVACFGSIFNGEADSAIRVRVSEDLRSGLYDLFTNSRADPNVIRNVFEVALELGRKGQKGSPVGALFVVGDAGKVMNKSRPLSYNPFEKSHVHVGDPIVNVMLKEFSRLDGAFVISDSGKIVSAYRYLEPSAEGIDIPKGLGARHMAGGAITRDTNATSIVLSESDGLVRAFKGGDLILELDPEEY